MALSCLWIRHRRRRPPAEVPKILAAVNKIWLTQANVEFVEVGGIRDVTIAQDLGDKLRQALLVELPKSYQDEKNPARQERAGGR